MTLLIVIPDEGALAPQIWNPSPCHLKTKRKALMIWNPPNVQHGFAEFKNEVQHLVIPDEAQSADDLEST
jgi:hypothetical protein